MKKCASDLTGSARALVGIGSEDVQKSLLAILRLSIIEGAQSAHCSRPVANVHITQRRIEETPVQLGYELTVGQVNVRLLLRHNVFEVRHSRNCRVIS